MDILRICNSYISVGNEYLKNLWIFKYIDKIEERRKQYLKRNEKLAEKTMFAMYSISGICLLSVVFGPRFIDKKFPGKFNGLFPAIFLAAITTCGIGSFFDKNHCESYRKNDL